MQGCDAVVMCTSAVPKILPFSILKLLFKKTILRRKDAGRPKFKFAAGGTPEEVDWLGAKLQIDCAAEAGVQQFIFVSSMGGTQPDNFLNSIGVSEADGTGGSILLWKRRAESYLRYVCRRSPMKYTIVHPGGLVDTPTAERELTVGVDDELLALEARQVPRGDVARVCVAALLEPAASENLSFDLASKPVGEGTVTEDAADVFASLAGRSCSYAGAPIVPPSIFAGAKD